jgi:hypothetical protein
MKRFTILMETVIGAKVFDEGSCRGYADDSGLQGINYTELDRYLHGCDAIPDNDVHDARIN